MFSNMDKGFKGMAEAAIQAIERIVEELLAKAAVLMIMKLLFPGAGIAAAAGGSILSLLGFANGTNNAPGGLSLVGEKGPELVNLPRGSQVIPNNKLGSQAITLTLKGRFDGKDIYFANQNYQVRLLQNT
jgi:hypothetical protein